MSWEIRVIATKSEPGPMAEFLKSWSTETISLGNTGEVKSKINSHFPTTFWDNENHGFVHIDNVHLEFAFDNEMRKYNAIHDNEDVKIEPDVKMITISIRGDGSPLNILAELARKNHWRLFESGGPYGISWVDLEKPAEDKWNEFKDYRDRVVRDDDSE